MRVLIFGLPGSGKSTLACAIVEKFPCLYLNGDKIRDIFKDNDFSIQGRINQSRRMKALSDLTQDVVVIADFVCPTEETRKIFNADLSIWMNTIQDSRYADTNKIFQKPKSADIIITTKETGQHVLTIIERIKSYGSGNKG